MKKSKNLKRNIELANDINELYIIGLLQDSFFKAESSKPLVFFKSPFNS